MGGAGPIRELNMAKQHRDIEVNEFKDKLAAGRLTRRAFNRTLSAAGLALTTYPLLSRRASAAEEAVVFIWGGYDVPEMYGKYVEKHGTMPKFSLYGDGNEAFQKVRAGFKPDVPYTCSPSVPRYRDAGLTQAIDTSRLSNWPDVFPALKTVPDTQFDGENWWIPFDWGRTSVTYRTDLVDIEEESLGLLWDERYSGKLAVFDSIEETVFVTAIYAGIDACNMDDQDLATVMALLKKQKPLLRFYSTDETSMVQALAAGEIVAATTWDSGALQLKKDGVPVKFMSPKEGVLTWTCGLQLLKDPPNLDKAFDVIDAMLDPSVGEFLLTEFGYGHSNKRTFERVSDKTLTALGLSRDPSELLSSGVAYCILKNKDKIIEMFQDVMAGY